MKKILILAHYYVPDTASTGQILRELAESLTEGFDVTVVCTVPSYLGTIEEKYKKEKVFHETINSVNVVRLRVPEFTKTKKISRIRNILAYYFGTRKLLRKIGEFDLVFSISQPPVLGGMLGAYAKKKCKAKYIYNIQDFNPEQILAVSYSKNRLLTGLMRRIDKKDCLRADRVVIVGRDMFQTMEQRFPKQPKPKVVFINNWTDDRAVFPLDAADERVTGFRHNQGLADKFIVMYSGNIGLYYDLDGITNAFGEMQKESMEQNGHPMLAADGREVALVFVGAGSKLQDIKALAQENKIPNVFFLPYQDKDKLVVSLNAADVHLCVNALGIKGVSVPSKLYGIMAAGKPVLGVLENGSEADMLINESGCGVVSAPNDYDSLKTNIRRFIETPAKDCAEMGLAGRRYLDQYLSKDCALNKYKELIHSLVD